MWLSLPEDASQSWFAIEPLTLLYPYKTMQGQIADALAPYSNVAKLYSKVTGKSVKTLTKEYLEEQWEVSEQNVALLKNAIDLWKTATKTRDAIAPILAHYSWHCFNSFFMYTFFRWNPQHSKSHGITIELDDELAKIRIKISRARSGLFQRLVDTWTIIGTSLAFSKFMPIVKNHAVEFIPNEGYLPCVRAEFDELSPKQLMEFKPEEYEKSLYATHRNDLLSCSSFMGNSVSRPNTYFRSYLLLFLASSIARYRPVLWSTILSGRGELESRFALDSSEALLHYTLGRHRGLGLIDQVTRILGAIEKGQFILRKSTDAKPIEQSSR